jgi:hypothetical protein
MERCEDLGDSATAVVSDHIDLIDLQCVERFRQHLGICSHRNVLIGSDLAVAVREQVD